MEECNFEEARRLLALLERQQKEFSTWETGQGINTVSLKAGYATMMGTIPEKLWPDIQKLVLESYKGMLKETRAKLSTL